MLGVVDGPRDSDGFKVIHKRLEKEIYPVEIKVNTSSREDVWALRQGFLCVGHSVR